MTSHGTCGLKPCSSSWSYTVIWDTLIISCIVLGLSTKGNVPEGRDFILFSITHSMWCRDGHDVSTQCWTKLKNYFCTFAPCLSLFTVCSRKPSSVTADGLAVECKEYKKHVRVWSRDFSFVLTVLWWLSWRFLIYNEQQHVHIIIRVPESWHY